MAGRPVPWFAAALVAASLCLCSRSAGSGPLWRDTAQLRDTAGGYTPHQIATAYDYTPLYREGIDGTGQTVALIEVDAYDSTDLATFDHTYNLPGATVTEQLVGKDWFNPDDGGETAIDVEWFHALAPGAVIHLYYLNNEGTQAQGWMDMAQALHKAVADGARTISISLNACGATHGYQVTRRALADLRQAGVTVFVSSGDSGAHPGPASSCGRRVGVAYPASDPSVVSVGGTSLRMTSSSTIKEESAWRRSGGGRGLTQPRSRWQAAAQLPIDGYRWIPDVSFVADPGTGVSMVEGGTWQVAGGTSLGAPAWAAAWVLTREAIQRAGGRVGAAPALVYQIGNSPMYGAVLHDIVRGHNAHFRAGVGWDALTGFGSPDVAAFSRRVQALVGAGS